MNITSIYFDTEDYLFARHQSGEEVSKEEWAHTVIGMFNTMSEGKLTFSDYRCLYENNEILISIAFNMITDATLIKPVSYTHLRAHETREDLVWRDGR